MSSFPSDSTEIWLSDANSKPGIVSVRNVMLTGEPEEKEREKRKEDEEKKEGVDAHRRIKKGECCISVGEKK